VPGASVTAELAPFHGRTWTFSGSAGQLIQIAMERTAGTLDSYLYLFGPDGTMVAQDDDSGGELNAFLLHVLESDGIYTILAAEMFGSQGTFELRLEQPEEPDPFTLARLCLQDGDEALCAQAAATADSAWYLCALLQSNDFAPAESACARAATLATPPIDFGNPVAGTLSPFQGAARTFFGTAGQRVRISMSASTDSALDSFLYLLGPDGELVAANDDGGGGESGLDSLLELVLPVTGRYTIVAADIYETAGQYLLLLEILE
jgi:serine protease Do